MKKLFLFLLIVLPAYLFITLSFLDKVYFLSPLEYKNGIIIRSDSRGDGYFGAERNGRRVHEGIDLLAEVGAPVYTSRSGIVIAAKESRGMGKFVIVRHAQNITTIYGHLSKIYTAKNAFLAQGELIAAVGRTGNANSPGITPHLHFEVRKSGIPQDPLEYLE